MLVRSCLGLALLTSACNRDRAPPPAPVLAASAAPSASSAPAAATATTKAPCRVASVAGSVTPALLPSGDVPRNGWLDLAEAAKLVVRDPRTTREVSFLGPAHVRACVRDEEEAWLASGTFESAVGAGEAPGSEVWVATPLGVVRYAAAGVSVTVGSDGATVKVARGAAQIAFVPPAKPAEGRPATDAGAPDDAAWMRLDAGQTAAMIWVGAEPPAARARTALDQCVHAGRKARALAAQLAGPAAAVGDLTPRHVAARRLARAACAVAEIRADGLGPDARAAQLEKIHDANAEWSKIGP